MAVSSLPRSVLLHRASRCTALVAASLTTQLLTAATLAAQGSPQSPAAAQPPADTTAGAAAGGDPSLPPDAAHAVARLNASPRHGQWVMIPRVTGDSIRAWIVYPERSSRAPVVLVMHEIFGLTSWIRSVADQLARVGYIAIAPDLLSGQPLPGAPDSVPMQASVAAVSRLKPAAVQRDLGLTARYATSLPAALPRYAVVGFCWGGSTAFRYAVHDPALGAAVVYYGASPPAAELASVRAPVLGLYGENDARVVATIAPADSAMRSLGKTFTHHIFAGATHGFLRAQDGAAGANLAATRTAWPATIVWLRTYIGR